MSASRPFAPTLTRALEALQGESRHGFTFVRADGEERWFSFGELVGLGARRAAALRARGVAKGDRVALVVPEGEEFVLSFIGAVMAGAIPVPMYPAVSFRNLHVYHDTVTHIAGAAGAKLMVTTASSREFVAPAAPRIPSLTGLVTVDDLAGDHGSLIEHAQPGDTAFLQFTSGSTSRPKGVVVTHDNLRANTEAFVKEGLAVDIDVDKGVSWLPMFHDMGLIGFVIGPLFGSVDVVFLPTASFVRRPGVWLEALSRHKGTITYAPNFAFQLVAKRVKERDLAELDLSPLRATGSGAEPINAKTLRDFADKLAPAGFDRRSFLASYGMAEATLAISFVPRGAGLTADAVDPKALEQGKASPASAEGGREIVSCGRSFAGHEVAIVDERGARLGEREVGEIVVKGPSVCAGYYGEPELTAGAIRDGWLHTGDLGYVAGGEIYVCGRLKDLIIIRGRNFYPSDIEWAVGDLPGVRRGNVVAFSVDAGGEEQLVVCVEGTRADAQSIREAAAKVVNDDFALNVREVVVIPLGTLPRTSSGKPQRRKTKQMYVDGAFDGALEQAASPSAQEGATEGA
ncbi:MAG: fatty acyl-AMP ligase [Myxococcales bacterium]|nr:fatty acyl-AMP ligase [Myxococcales bacterium]